MPIADPEKRRAWRLDYERRNREQIARAQRRKKMRYRGVCEDCGGATYGEKPDAAPAKCIDCFNRAREPEHGTYVRYTSSKHRCRCEACKRAHAEYMRGYHARRRANGGPLGHSHEVVVPAS